MGPQKPSSGASKTKLASKRPNARGKSLKSGRPPLLSASSSSGKASSSGPSITAPSLSSRHTRTLIRTHHTLQKRLSRARAENDSTLVRELESQLSASGGLATYQHASIVGQSAERGGDSSRVLVRWLKDDIDLRRKSLTEARRVSSPPPPPAGSGQLQRPEEKKPAPLRILEIGALSTTNALNIPHATTVRRIDLRSSAPGIEEMDFMRFPLPDDPSGKGVWQGEKGYDVLSLSLVLNYVPDARGRGDMLRRTTRFFADYMPRSTSSTRPTSTSGEKRINYLPCLFLVLPAPTLHNSRYLTPSHLDLIMSSLGYTRLETKTTQKLHYSLWRYDRDRLHRRIKKDGGGGDGGDGDGAQPGPTVFAKKEINPGAGRNNFCIVLD
ncbi:25S rRNA (adenine2142-N1)-methyltransferase [Rhinocladiella similis]